MEIKIHLNMSSKYRIEPNLTRGGASAGRIGRDENETIRFYLMIISIRFDEIVYFLFAFAWTHLHHHMASLTMALLILSVVFIFVIHVNRMLNAGFFVQKNFSNVVY